MHTTGFSGTHAVFIRAVVVVSRGIAFVDVHVGRGFEVDSEVVFGLLASIIYAPIISIADVVTKDRVTSFPKEVGAEQTWFFPRTVHRRPL